MNKKRVALSLVFILTILLISFAYAADEDTNKSGFEKAYDCLKDEIDTAGVANLQVEEQAFSLLALAYDSDYQSKIKTALKAEGGPCWPEDDCTLKDTALALMALDYIGEDTTATETWFTNNSDVPSELVWYLEIDKTGSNAGGMACDITYQENTRSITIGEDGQISGSGGSCLSPAQDDYWLEVDNDCFEEDFDITCDDDFITTLLYKKRGDEIFYVSTLTHSGILGGTTSERVESLCFEENNRCDYEGSLWATLALRQAGADYDDYLPYLIALSSDNSRYLPSAFLYMILGYDEYFDELINAQQPEGYWQTSSGKRYYDTALALMALEDVKGDQLNEALDYLLDGQPPKGCWGSLRDTAFILYSASRKSPTTTGGDGNGDGNLTISYCEEYNYFCATQDTCLAAGGDYLSNYRCDSWSNPDCCSVDVTLETCSQKSGVTCTADQDCSGNFAAASDTSYCCLHGSCTAKTSTQTACASAGHTCQTTCGDKEEKTQFTGSCPSIEKCCADEVAKKRSLWWVWLLLILILLIILAIIYRDQIKVYIFKAKSKFSKEPVQAQPRPAFPPAPPGRPPMRAVPPRRLMPGRPPVSRRPAQYPKERELKSTIKKLKKIGE